MTKAKCLGILLFLFFLLPSLPLRAQFHSDFSESSDELQYSYEEKSFNPTQLIAPGVLIGSGIVIRSFAHSTWNTSVNVALDGQEGSAPHTELDDWIQYLAFPANLGLEFLGVPAKNDFVGRVIETSISVLSVAAITQAMKALIFSPRPIGDARSFPSGHTATAFVGAELLRIEYGWLWGGIGYLAATSVAILRMHNRAHWLSDVLAGAGIGILCANIGRWLLVPVKNLLNINPKLSTEKEGLNLSAEILSIRDSYSGSLCMGLSFKLQI